MGKILKAIIYARQSSGDEEESASVEQQKANCRALAREKGITVVAEYDDLNISGRLYPDTVESRLMAAADQTLKRWLESISGKQMRFRKGLGQALTCLKTVDYILLDDYTRLMRPLTNSFLEGHLRQLLLGNKVKLLCVKGGEVDPEKFTDNLVATLISQINADQLENQRLKSKEVLKTLRDNGLRPCGNNFRGYRHVGKHKYEIEETGAAFVRKAFDMGVKNYSYMDICRQLGKEFSYRDLHYDTLIPVYRRPEYAGYMYNSSGELIEAQEFKDIRLITLDQFQQMQKRLNNRRIHNHDRKHTYAFTGLCYCGYCNERMQIASCNAMPHSWEAGQRLRYFTCIRNVYRDYCKDCGRTHIRYQYYYPYGWRPGMPRIPVKSLPDPDKELIPTGMHNLGLYESLMALVALPILQEKRRLMQTHKADANVEKLKLRQSQLQRKEHNLHEMYSRDSLSDDQYERAINILKRDQEEIQKQIKEQQGLLSIDVNEERKQLGVYLHHLRIKRIDDHLYKKYAQEAIERITVFAYHIQIKFRNQKIMTLERIPHRAARVLPDWSIRFHGDKAFIKYYYKSFFKGDLTEQVIYEDHLMHIVTIGRNPKPGEWKESPCHTWGGKNFQQKAQ